VRETPSGRTSRAAPRPSRARGGARDDENAFSQVLGFLVAGVVFLGAVGAILMVSTEEGEGDQRDPESAAQSVQAASLADLLVSSPGVGWAGGADSLLRLGLEAGNGSGLDLASIESLRGAVYEADPDNDRVDYEEALAGLDIPAGTDFHLRMYPVGLDAVYQDVLTGTRVAYLGDWTALAPVIVPLGTTSAMVAAANLQLNVTMAVGTSEEREAIRLLGVDYDDEVHMDATNPTILVEAGLIDPTLFSLAGASALAGDVFPDNKQYLDNVLSTRLPEYDVLFVGSGVDHSALTSSVTKNAIRDFVHAGGTLMVMGSSAQSTQWLQPLFDVGIKTVNGGPFAPDVSHPLLHEPHALDWDAYDNHGLGWDLKTTGAGAHYDDFTHVIVASGKDVLAVSNDGAFGEGRIFLTEFRPREISSDMGLVEAQNFLGNMFLYSERDHLYLEYGPQVPDGTEVTAAIRQSHAWDSQLGQVPVRLEIHLWQEPTPSGG
jgi:hypothetical protein